MRFFAALGLLFAASLAGCRGDYGMRCEDQERYAGSQETAPVHVPDDLSVPAEDDALRIPPSGQLPAPQPRSSRGPCLESPPSYFENGADNAAAPADETAAPSD